VGQNMTMPLTGNELSSLVFTWHDIHTVLSKCAFLLPAQSSSTVGLQLECGERLVKEFPSSASLWDVLTHWDSDQDRLED